MTGSATVSLGFHGGVTFNIGAGGRSRWATLHPADAPESQRCDIFLSDEFDEIDLILVLHNLQVALVQARRARLAAASSTPPDEAGTTATTVLPPSPGRDAVVPALVIHDSAGGDAASSGVGEGAPEDTASGSASSGAHLPTCDACDDFGCVHDCDVEPADPDWGGGPSDDEIQRAEVAYERWLDGAGS